MSRYDELIRQMQTYAHEYYALNNPSVSDAVYDGLMRELKQIEADDPDGIRADSPTQRVGSEPLDQFTKVAHSQRMISLNDVFSQDDVQAWLDRIAKLQDVPQEFFTDIKMDGLGLSLTY